MTAALFTPRALRELRAAAAWIAADNPQAALTLLDAATDAARRVTAHSMLARAEPRLAPPRFRFWSLRGFPHLLVIDTEHDPLVIARVVHRSHDLPAALDEE